MKSMKKRWKQWFLMLATCVALIPSQANAVPTGVGLELMLLVDVSGSVDSSEYLLQKNGYVAAFQNSTIHSAIAGISGGIAVAYAEWSGPSQQSLEVGWTHVTDATSANNFANAIAAATRNFNGSTAPGSAINFGVSQILNNDFQGSRLVIDVSGDGRQNSGADTFTAANNAFSHGITVNGLPILTDDSSLGTWYQTNIVTPGHGFMIVANNFTDFRTAIVQKIGKEVTGTVPEPASFLLLGSGLAGLGMWRRSTSKARPS